MPSNQTHLSPHRTLRISAIVAVLVAAGLVAFGIASRANSDEKLKQWTNERAVPSVSLVSPDNQGALSTLDLPGRFVAYAHAPIYARVSGYLKSWNVDIGGQVKAGQLLAEIETPDLDQQLLQARADLASAEANVALARTTAKRWQGMLESDSVSRQEVDDRTGDLASKEAMLKASQANLDRLIATKRFARIVAPFNGTVTARTTDNGALITEGGSGSALFEVSDTHKLRLYVNVPQNFVNNIKPGTKADINVPERPDKTYTAIVESTSGAVDVASGATLVQLVVDNTAGELLPGGYANVSLHQAGSTATFSIPASALIFDQSGLRVATVNADNKASLKTVTIARDLGKVIQLASGVEATDRVIESPPDGIADGDVVNVVETPAKPTDKKS
ncbi:efflux RND transporter periplasmic adaptor subunit [Methyloradius palustris]|uniref:RND transporter MFP subunit n=1 Tax=Methyloradius palustris TaxID=2778876 RepID=A0A8D5FY44_9PROT|nr:efflux RND transporter periplasmic adaptor subunit [Methyloradius palustris]BCM24274.1 RND transporter MFP subunit [Methyloradius palustris]